MDANDKFQRELDTLEGHLPKWALGAFQRARAPGAVWIRSLVAIFLIIGGILGIVLPVLELLDGAVRVGTTCDRPAVPARSVYAVTGLHQPKARLTGRLSLGTAAI